MQLAGKPKEQSPSKRKVTPPSPSYMNNDQFASYLAGLRDNRVKRPGGARPPPPSTRTQRDSLDYSTTGRPSIGNASFQSEASSAHQRTGSDAAKPRGSRPSIAGSVRSRYSTNTTSGKDYYPEKPNAPLKPSDVVPSAAYIESGQRWMEKEEAFSLHQALDALEVKDKGESGQQDDDETKLYKAALNEASELVWQHQHGVKPREPGAPYQYKPHLRRDSYAHARAASAGRYGSDVGATGLARDSYRSFSGSSSGSDAGSSLGGSRRQSLERNVSSGSVKTKPPVAMNNHHRRSSMKRNISGEIQKPFSGDQIWEESEASTTQQNPRQPQMPARAQPSGLKSRVTPNRVQFAPRSSDESLASDGKPLSRTEIHRNPPSQSRNPNYTTNTSSESPRTSAEIPTKNGVELRSDDIRQATSMRLKNRSEKLPTPSAVSDSPGRPIVSFDRNWKAAEEATDSKPEESNRVPFRFAKERPGSQNQNPQPPIPTIAFTPDFPESTPSKRSSRPPQPPAIPSIQIDADEGPQVPAISISDSGPAVPTIVLPGDDEPSSGGKVPEIPVIITPDDDKKTSPRPLPTPGSGQRPLPNVRGGQPRGHWSPAPNTSRRATATCHECGYPIEGRFVALKGVPERFHPQCFRCHTCGTGLEALEISPEPEAARAARLERIRRRAAGEALAEEPGQTMAEDGDARLRFYCHLDWHEQFAPRCRHCRTPILGDHVTALGAHWHHGHFFCAECGDPFAPGATHVEVEGYAWCVGCQTRRTARRAPKCRRCRAPVVGQYVVALGAEWHDDCFRCAACGGGFDDGQVFPVGMEDDDDDLDGGGEDGSGKSGRRGACILCTGCRARELKM
ncbi:hypothetical protein GGR56DRAFT_680438 [Xylariaceae sp. FL0804]|nr:hypothetical protein GGR56DRAFT_680438 [Xylariaceae sp. FL0804]